MTTHPTRYLLRFYATRRIAKTGAHPSWPKGHTWDIEIDTDPRYLTRRAAAIAAGTDDRIRTPVDGFVVQVIDLDSRAVVATA